MSRDLLLDLELGLQNVRYIKTMRWQYYLLERILVER